jgi:hypothetical protein
MSLMAEKNQMKWLIGDKRKEPVVKRQMQKSLLSRGRRVSKLSIETKEPAVMYLKIIHVHVDGHR